MYKKAAENQQKNCPSCGAPIVSEICAYCGMATGLNTADADMEYPLLECKEASIGFWTVGFPLIFAGAFGVPGLILLFIAVMGFRHISMLLVGVPFLLIGAVALILALRTVFRYIKVKTRGKPLRATVYGYMDDNVLINNRPAQIVKLLVQTPVGPRFILYQLGKTVHPYGIHDRIDIMVYRNYFMICKNNEFVSW